MSVRIDVMARSFARDLRAEGCSPRTVGVYGQALVLFVRRLASESLPESMESLTRSHIRAWLSSLGVLGLLLNR